MKLRRILHVNGAMNMGGAETMVMNLYRNINRSDYQFDFLYYTKEKCHFDQEIINLGGQIFRVKAPNPGNYLNFIKNVRDVIKNQGPFSAIHIHTLLNSGLVAYAAKKEGVPIRIVHALSTKGGKKESYIYKIYEKVMKNLIRGNTTHFIACGNDAGDYLFGKEKYSTSGIFLPNAIDVDRFMSYDEKTIFSLRNTLGISNDTLIIGQIGAFKDVKNHHFSLKIAKMLRDKNINFCMLFIGDGENRETLKEQVSNNELSDYVRFLGIRTDIPELLSMLDILIMPSLFEGLPVTLIEAQAARVPAVISTNISEEVDFQLGLIKRLNLSESVELWVKEIEFLSSHKKYVEPNKIYNAFGERGYLIQESVKILEKIYSTKNL